MIPSLASASSCSEPTNTSTSGPGQDAGRTARRRPLRRGPRRLVGQRIGASVYLVDDRDEAAVPLDIALEACANDDVPEIRTVARTMLRWREEILNHHRTAASN